MNEFLVSNNQISNWSFDSKHENYINNFFLKYNTFYKWMNEWMNNWMIEWINNWINNWINYKNKAQGPLFWYCLQAHSPTHKMRSQIWLMKNVDIQMKCFHSCLDTTVEYFHFISCLKDYCWKFFIEYTTVERFFLFLMLILSLRPTFCFLFYFNFFFLKKTPYKTCKENLQRVVLYIFMI